jgi:hypothetical protein
VAADNTFAMLNQCSASVHLYAMWLELVLRSIAVKSLGPLSAQFFFCIVKMSNLSTVLPPGRDLRNIDPIAKVYAK